MPHWRKGNDDVVCQRAVNEDMADLPRPEFLRVGRLRRDGVDRPRGQELRRCVEGVSDPVDLLPGVYAHIGEDAGDEGVVGAAQLARSDRLALQVVDGADPLARKQLEAAEVSP